MIRGRFEHEVGPRYVPEAEEGQVHQSKCEADQVTFMGATARTRSALCLLTLLLWLGATAAAATPHYSSEALRIQQKAQASAGWRVPLQQRVERLRSLTIATISLAALGAILANLASTKAKVGSAVAGALVVALTSARAQVYLADKDSAEAIQVGLSDYRDDVENQFGAYKENLDQLDQLANSGAATTPQTTQALDAQAEWNQRADRALERMQTLQIDGSKLISRARLLLGVTDPPDRVVADWGFSAFPVAFAQSTNVPSWVKSLSADPDYLQDIGESLCSANYGAREYARYDGRRRLALKLEPSASGARLNTVIKTINSSVQDREQYSVTENGRIRSRVWVRLFTEKALAQVRALPRAITTPAVSWKGEGSLPLSGSAQVTGAAANRNGTFTFDFSVVRAGRSSTITLDSMAIREDGTVGSTRWAFDVSTSDGTLLFSIPTHPLDDGGKPTVCWPQANEKLRGTATYDTPRTLRVDGFRGADY